MDERNGSRQTPTVDPKQYDVSDVFPVEGFDSVRPGTNLLVVGPPQSGTVRLALRLLARGTAVGEPAIAVSPNLEDERLHVRFESADGDLSLLHTVDCSGASGKGSFDDTAQVNYVSSPADLTGIGLGVVKCTRRIGSDVRGVRLSLLSLSTMLRYTELDRLFTFLHVLTGRVSAAGYFSVSTADSTVDDPQELNVLRSLYDAVIEFRETDDGSHEIRIVGHEDAPSTWMPR